MAVAALMQYFLMAAFCWMLVEGMYLYFLVVKVYNINNKMNMYYVMSWGKLLRNELFYCYFINQLLLIIINYYQSLIDRLIRALERMLSFYRFVFPCL